MRFSVAASISRGADDDWFDPVMEQDSPLYIDPFLLFDDDDPHWVGAYDQIVAFFETAATYVIAANGQTNTPAWRKALRLLKFPEPHEFALGVALGSPRGSGTGEEFARRIAGVLQLVGGTQVARLASVGGFALFCDGIGMDRISDIVGNILKDRFVSYTNMVMTRHNVPTEIVPVKHVSWSAERGNWRNDNLPLFPNPATGGGILLVPKRFLKDIPRIEADGFWDWASLAASAELRDDLNFDLSESLTKSEKVARARRVALARPEIALTYVDLIAAQSHTSYDFAGDPRGFVGWYEEGSGAASLIAPDAPSGTAPTGPDDFNDWVMDLAKDFQFVIENTDAWRALWNDNYSKPRQEKIAQVVASVLWRSQCKVANVDLSKETNIGRGPVDFKFSQGWERRALLEMKYIASSHFSQGANKQLPQYLRSEEIAFGVYLAIGFTDADFERPRVRLVEETCAAISNQMGREIKLVLVDARPKASASNL